MAFLTDAIQRVTSRVGFTGAFRVATLAGNETLTHFSAQLQALDPGGSSRDLTLPAEGGEDHGYFFVLLNTADAAESLVVKDADANTIATIPQNGWGIVYNDSGAWAQLAVVTASGVA